MNIFGKNKVAILEDKTQDFVRAFIQLSTKYEIVSFISTQKKEPQYGIPSISLDDFFKIPDIDDVLLVVCSKHLDCDLSTLIERFRNENFKLYRNYIFYENILHDNYFDLMKYTTLYSTKEITESLIFLKRYKKLYFVNGNCQTDLLFEYLQRNKEFASKYMYLNIPSIHIFDSKIMDIDVYLKYIDLIITQPIKETNKFEKKLSTSYLKKNKNENCILITISNITSRLYYPQYAKTKNVNSFSLLGKKLFTYHDANINNFLSQGVVVDEIKRRLNAIDFYDKVFMDAHCQEQLIDFQQREADCDIKMYDFIKENYSKRRCFHAFNHPCQFVIQELSKRVLTYLNMNHDMLEEDSLDALSKMFYQEQPIYPCVLSYFNFNYYNYKYYPNKFILDNNFNFNDYIELYSSTYKLSNRLEEASDSTATLNTEMHNDGSLN